MNSITINNITIGYACVYNEAAGKYTHTVTRLNAANGDYETHAFTDISEAVAVYNALVKEAVEGKPEPVENPAKPRRKFRVKMLETYVAWDEIEADTAEEAEEIAYNRIANEEYQFDDLEDEKIIVEEA